MKIWIQAIVAIILLNGLFQFISDQKYEGLTAKQWAYQSDDWQSRYNNLKSCIEHESRYDEEADEVSRRCL
jgi:hypothetical protein